SMPGVGVRTAAVLLTTVGDGTSFPTAAHLASYAGLAPTTKSSGTSIHDEHSLPASGQGVPLNAVWRGCQGAPSRVEHVQPSWQCERLSIWRAKQPGLTYARGSHA
ncbi:transposase, partial [Streptomyces sp. NPDC002908]|uniref:transposase n=1 Tax=Streptomyces sp. NPDC002908 TaxID=3364670 RepID=UPI0036902D19